MESGTSLRFAGTLFVAIALSVDCLSCGAAEAPSSASDAAVIVAMLEGWQSKVRQIHTSAPEQAQVKYKADRMLDEAIVSARQGDYKQAAIAFDSVIESCVKSGLLANDSAYNVHNVTGMLLLVQDKNDEALLEFNRARIIAERVNGKLSIEAIAANRNAAICDIRSGKNFERARSALEEAQNSYRKLNSTNGSEYRAVLKWLAVCSVELRNNTEAIRYQTEVCDLLRAQKLQPNNELVDAIQILAQYYAHDKNWESARIHFDEAAMLYEELRGADDPATKAARASALKMAQAADESK